MSKLRVRFLDWGRISYEEAWAKQTQLHEELKEIKIKNRKEGTQIPQNHYLIFCEHNPVYTLGKSGDMQHLLLDSRELQYRGIEFFKINRGGDITYHGPGQIVAYPIFDLDEIFTDVHKYVRFLEEAVIRVIEKHGINGERIKGLTGVWIRGNETEKNKKICAIGVHLSRWVSMHGLAFNVNTDISYFKNIIPCGINEDDKEVCSMQSLLGKKIDYEQVKKELRESFEEQFNIELYD